MEIFVNQESGAAFVRLRKLEPGEKSQRTRTFAKHGIAMEWNGHGELIGIVFAGNGKPVDIHTNAKDDDREPVSVASERRYVGPWPDQPGPRTDR